jgi:hypothetical protein
MKKINSNIERLLTSIQLAFGSNDELLSDHQIAILAQLRTSLRFARDNLKE